MSQELWSDVDAYTADLLVREDEAQALHHRLA